MNDFAAPPALIDASPAAQRVIDACRDAGGRPLVVGGAVRDALLGLGGRPKDVDLEVHDVDDTRVLVESLSRVAAVSLQGAAFEVIAVRLDGQDFDISLPPPGARDERDSFARRDFTVNAMGWDPVSRRLIDPFGGREDLDRGVLRHTSDAFSDDPLRVMRGVQFAGRFGFSFAAETAELCATLAPRFAELAGERVWGEWRKLARRAVYWPEALAALAQSGWGEHFPQLDGTRGVPQDPVWHAEGDVWTHLGLAARSAAESSERDGLAPEVREVVVLATLLHDVGKVTHTRITEGRITSSGHAEAGVAPARRFLERIGAPRHVVESVLPLVRDHMAHVSVVGVPSRQAVRRLMRRLGAERGASIYEWARVVDADCAGRAASAKPSPARDWLEIADTIGVSAQRPILTGAHLVARGLTPGPGFGPVLRRALAAQDDEEFTDETGALAWLARQHEL